MKGAKGIWITQTQEISRRKSEEEVVVGWNWGAERKQKRRMTKGNDSLASISWYFTDKAESRNLLKV